MVTALNGELLECYLHTNYKLFPKIWVPLTLTNWKLILGTSRKVLFTEISVLRPTAT